MKALENQEPWLERFGQKLNDYEEPLPTGSWEQLEARLPTAVLRTEQKGRTRAVKRWLSIAAALLVAVTSLYLLTKKQEAATPLNSSMNASVITLSDQNTLSLPMNVTNLFCEGSTCYYLDRNLVDRARIYAVNDGGIALFLANRNGFELEGQTGMDTALQASLLKTLNDHRQVFLQSLSAIFHKGETMN